MWLYLLFYLKQSNEFNKDLRFFTNRKSTVQPNLIEFKYYSLLPLYKSLEEVLT